MRGKTRACAVAVTILVAMLVKIDKPDLTLLEDADYPGIGGRLLDEGGQLRRFVNVYVGEEDIRLAQGLDTPVSADGQVSVIPAVAGG